MGDGVLIEFPARIEIIDENASMSRFCCEDFPAHATR
jgi:hypothetical protein